MSALGTAGALLGCTYMVMGKMVDSTVAAAGCSTALAGGVSKEAAMVAKG